MDDLISLALLIEKARQISPGSVAPLRDVITSLKTPSVHALWAAVGQSASSPLLAAVFDGAGSGTPGPVPDKALNSPWVERISEALNLMSPAGIPFAFFGDFHQLCLARPLEASFFHFGTLKAERRRHDWGSHYTPTPIVEHLVHRTLSPRMDGGDAGANFPPRILDPSCGCGAFLIAATEFLLRSRAANGSSAEQRIQLVARAVFGTDIDQKAVSWTRRLLLLTVWASCVEDGLDSRCVALASLTMMRQNIVPVDFLRSDGSWKGRDEHPVPESFDVIIGGPPFVRLHDLHKTQPDRIEEYKRQFVSARHGAFDLYTLFIEKSLRLLREGGHLGFSVSNSFLRSSSGKSLRELIAQTATVEEIVEFPDTQVYPEAKVQIALLCLRKGTGDSLTRAIQLRGAYAVEGALKRLRLSRTDGDQDIEVGLFSIPHLGGRPWLCADTSGEACLSKMERAGTKMGRLPIDISGGASTGVDKVFLLQYVQEGTGGSVFVCEREYGETFQIESGAARPILRGRDIEAYVPPEPATLCIFPYDDEGRLLPERTLQERLPLAYGYLMRRKDRLIAAAERADDAWWAPRIAQVQDAPGTPRLSGLT